MAKSSAERQRAYRARRTEGEGDRRINGWISTAADLALDRLARHHNLTRRGMLELLILTADHGTKQGMSDAEFDQYVTP
jgi:hypothetical protein